MGRDLIAVSDAAARGRQTAIDLLDSARSNGLLMGLKGKSVRRDLERIIKTNDADELAGFAEVLDGRLKASAQRSVTDPAQLVVPAACVRDTGTEIGDGVFALRSFKPGEVVEICPVILLTMSPQKVPDDFPRALTTRLFAWGNLTGGQYGGCTQALALGLGSMYNHDNPSNMCYEAIREGALLRFVAVRGISVDEELTINYNAIGGGHQWHDNNWFDRNKVPLMVRTP